MEIFLTESRISNLLQEEKPLPKDYMSRIKLRAKRGHSERELDLTGKNGDEFRLVLRQSLINPLDFSVILMFKPKESTRRFRLVRYNGKSHAHTNPIENESFYGFHIHRATERYQELGGREDTYAELTDAYENFDGALACMFRDCGFPASMEIQMNLFEGV